MLRQALLCSTVANTTPNFLRVQGSGFRPVDGFRPFVAYNCPSKCHAETPLGGRYDLGQTHKLTSTTSFSRQPLQTSVRQSEAELVLKHEISVDAAFTAVERVWQSAVWSICSQPLLLCTDRKLRSRLR